jgi:hypothetical protein
MPLQAVDVDVGQLDGRRLKNRPVVVGLDEFSRVGGLATGRSSTATKRSAMKDNR